MKFNIIWWQDGSQEQSYYLQDSSYNQIYCHSPQFIHCQKTHQHLSRLLLLRMNKGRASLIKVFYSGIELKNNSTKLFIHNIIMAYSGNNFNGRLPNFPFPTQQFVPWSQALSYGNCPNPLLSPFYPPPPIPPPVHFQQNNYFSANPSLSSFNSFIQKLKQSNLSLNEAAFRQHYDCRPKNTQVFSKNSSKATEIIEISDDEGPTVKICAVIVNKQKQFANQSRARNQKLRNTEINKKIIQTMSKKIQEIRKYDEQQTKKIVRVPKKNQKNIQIQRRQDIKLAKKKKIVNKEEKLLMELSRYRQLRPELIMTGPQFQAKIPPSLWSNRNRQSILSTLRDKLLSRKQR